MNETNEINELARFRAEIPRPELADLREQERLLLAAMGDSGARSHRRHLPRLPRLLIGATVTAAMAAAAVAGLTLLQDRAGTATSYANAAIDIRLSGDDYVATIKDPFADHTQYSEGFKALGLEVGLQLVPVSPSRVGDIVRYGFSGTTEADKLGGGLSPEGCAPGTPGCALTVTVSKGFSGKGTVYVGRQARPGERYGAHAAAEAKGEMLEGYDPVERTVAEVAAEVRRRGLSVEYQIITPAKNGGGFSADPNDRATDVRDHWIVWAAESAREGTVRLLVSEKRVAKNPVHGN
ncbi:hypothetical protein C1I98_32400 [Spongiactinospora gelatinilytica]|uniref:Uncharacterized protein n=1 Tax=Spongiactinospora gelatinilytica TaxID=2666298 RepID=A0A2W2G4S4_9ACTN|nr:hypothetical protein [Spongiactinospora gelatinilytica]PZG29187.1 hypothetical protein C1I98_32400 [Spongiactinospora gelatinilytica]